MLPLNKERTIWENTDKKLLLTTHRLRLENKSIFGSEIQSIMLEELTSCELHTLFSWWFVRKAAFWFVLLNGAVFLLNNFLFKAKLIAFLFGEVNIGIGWVQVIFYLSLSIVAYFIIRFFLAIKKVFSFNATGMTIHVQMRWLSFEERENFISMIEQAKDDRMQSLSGHA